VTHLSLVKALSLASLLFLFMKLDERLKKRIGVDLDLCWFPDCGAVWKTEEAEFHEDCQTFKCPKCKRCFCDLDPFTQYVLDAELASLGIWSPFTNPKRRKRRRGGVTWICNRCGRSHPDSYVSERGIRCSECGGGLDPKYYHLL